MSITLPAFDQVLSGLTDAFANHAISTDWNNQSGEEQPKNNIIVRGCSCDNPFLSDSLFRPFFAENPPILSFDFALAFPTEGEFRMCDDDNGAACFNQFTELDIGDQCFSTINDTDHPTTDDIPASASPPTTGVNVVYEQSHSSFHTTATPVVPVISFPSHVIDSPSDSTSISENNAEGKKCGAATISTKKVKFLGGVGQTGRHATRNSDVMIYKAPDRSRRFPCPEPGCTQKCKSRGDLIRHLECRDHQESSYFCKCGTSYTRKDARLRHQRKMKHW